MVRSTIGFISLDRLSFMPMMSADASVDGDMRRQIWLDPPSRQQVRARRQLDVAADRDALLGRFPGLGPRSCGCCRRIPADRRRIRRRPPKPAGSASEAPGRTKFPGGTERPAQCGRQKKPVGPARHRKRSRA